MWRFILRKSQVAFKGKIILKKIIYFVNTAELYLFEQKYLLPEKYLNPQTKAWILYVLNRNNATATTRIS